MKRRSSRLRKMLTCMATSWDSRKVSTRDWRTWHYTFWWTKTACVYCPRYCSRAAYINYLMMLFSAVDTKTENTILNAMKKVMIGRTSIVISQPRFFGAPCQQDHRSRRWVVSWRKELTNNFLLRMELIPICMKNKYRPTRLLKKVVPDSHCSK